MAKGESEHALIAYVPVIHRGYLNLFTKHPDADMYILDEDVLADFDYLKKDIRALRPAESRVVVEGLNIFDSVQLLGKLALANISDEYKLKIMPNDDLSRQLSERDSIQPVLFEPIFLRWDRDNAVVNQEVQPDRVVQADDFQENIIRLLYEEGEKATSWWRRVGAAIVIDSQVLYSAHNYNVPTEYTSYIDGDPRSALHKGVGIEITNDAHAESTMIATAARDGVPIRGADILIDTFPCPKCAKDIATAELARCYYIDGYAVTDALDVLRSANVEVIKIETDVERPPKGREWVTYPA